MPLGRNFLAQKGQREPRTQFAAFAAATTACGGRREERGDSNARRRVIGGGNLGFRKRNEGKKKLQLVSIFYGADRILLLFSPLLLTGRCSTPKLFTWQKKPRLFYLPPLFSVIVSRSFFGPDGRGKKFPLVTPISSFHFSSSRRWKMSWPVFVQATEEDREEAL